MNADLDSVFMGVGPLNPENAGTGVLPKIGGAFSASTGAWALPSEILVGSGPVVDNC